MNNNDYRRSLIMMRSVLNGYGGHARIEIRTMMGSLNILASVPQGTHTVQAALVGKRRGEYYAYPLGTLRRDLRGQAGLTATFDPRNLGGRTLEAYSVLALAQVGEPCELAMVGNLDGSCEMDWSRVRAAVCALYETTDEESVNHLPSEDAEAWAEEKNEETEKEEAQEETAPPFEEEEAVEAMSEEKEPEIIAEEPKAEDMEIIREEPEIPPCLKGVRLMRIRLPILSGYPFAYIGRAEDEAKYLCAVPAPFTPQPPAGLEGCRWEGGTGIGWWVSEYPDE